MIKMKKLLFILLMSVAVLSAAAQTAMTYDGWVARSFEALEADSVAEAVSCLKEAMRLEPANPQNAMLLTNLGTLERRLGQTDEALLAYSSALMLMPKSVPLLLSRAALYAELEQWPKAEEDYTTILYIEPDQEEALYRRGMVRFERGDTLGARIDFERLVRENTVSSKGRLGIALLLKAAGNYAMAEEMYSQVIKANPNQAELYLKRAEVYYLDGKLSKGISDINRCLELRPDDGMAYMIRGRLRLAQYDKQQALADFRRAAELGVEQTLVDEWVKRCK